MGIVELLGEKEYKLILLKQLSETYNNISKVLIKVITDVYICVHKSIEIRNIITAGEVYSATHDS